jgi:PAS domain S-box-containing protein
MRAEFDLLLESLPVFKDLFENATVNAIQVMDEDGYILDVNEAFTHSFGYLPEDLHGKHCRVLFTIEDQRALLPEMEIEQVRQHGSSSDRNYTMHKDGSCIWVSGESVLVRDQEGKNFIVKLIQNFHEQKLLEKFLKESQEFSESVVRSINDGLIVVDVNGKILKVNNTFYSLFQINQDNIEGQNLSNLDHSFLSADKLKNQIESVIETGAQNEMEFDWSIEGGVTKNLLVKTSFLDGKLAEKRILLLVTDATEKIQQEQQKDDLIAFVIHELRNPMASITLSNKLLEEAINENDKEGIQDYLLRTRTNITRLNGLIREMFDATKAGAGSLQYTKGVFDFDELVQEIIETVQAANPSHKIRKYGEAGLEVYADRNRIGQALSNYLINAVKYSPNTNKVDVEVLVEGGNIIVSVADYGPGIAEENVPHVFNRYYRADPTAKAEGLGLGLYLCKQIIDAHNGRVWIKSKAGEGSTFYFSIPAITS